MNKKIPKHITSSESTTHTTNPFFPLLLLSVCACCSMLLAASTPSTSKPTTHKPHNHFHPLNASAQPTSNLTTPSSRLHHPTGSTQSTSKTPKQTTTTQPTSKTNSKAKRVFLPPLQIEQAHALLLWYTGGIKGYIEPCGCQSDMLGGIARLSTLAKRYQAHKHTTLHLDAGNLLFEYTKVPKTKKQQALRKARLLANTFQFIGYSAMGVGPHDLALGRSTFKQLCAQHKITPISSNLWNKEQSKHAFSPYLIKTLRNHKFGILSLTTLPKATPQEAKAFWNVRGLHWQPPQKAIKMQLKALQRHKVDTIVLLSTLGLSATQNILQKFPTIDIAFEGEEGKGLQTLQSLNRKATLLGSNEKEGRRVGVLALYPTPQTTPKPWKTLPTADAFRKKQRKSIAQIKLYQQQAQKMREQGKDFYPIAQVYLQQAQELKKHLQAERKNASAPLKLPPNARAYTHELVALSAKIPDHPQIAKALQRYTQELQKLNQDAMKDIKAIPFTQNGDFYAGAQ
ncbi:MAG: hypothetical protein AAGJ35_04775, partial [Myxococcota bacterium]